eukprot:gnl/TRDRNA2_/TRDRNA2_183414_c0_seq1.p1 gnl/TRDRNA2_/TRDRNA2_183414_c0~~gnl/TRDRNA2_/TRDRNA2_183414_c0_seq1.p1  ORF type:complete len:642 (-),score=143.45 gnl/TRDRNA2_/TRDRNA2_183414_c0_seq1:69-1994(-)
MPLDDEEEEADAAEESQLVTPKRKIRGGGLKYEELLAGLQEGGRGTESVADDADSPPRRSNRTPKPRTLWTPGLVAYAAAEQAFESDTGRLRAGVLWIEFEGPAPRLSVPADSGSDTDVVGPKERAGDGGSETDEVDEGELRGNGAAVKEEESCEVNGVAMRRQLRRERRRSRRIAQAGEVAEEPEEETEEERKQRKRRKRERRETKLLAAMVEEAANREQGQDGHGERLRRSGRLKRLRTLVGNAGEGDQDLGDDHAKVEDVELKKEKEEEADEVEEEEEKKVAMPTRRSARLRGEVAEEKPLGARRSTRSSVAAAEAMRQYRDASSSSSSSSGSSSSSSSSAAGQTLPGRQKGRGRSLQKQPPGGGANGAAASGDTSAQLSKEVRRRVAELLRKQLDGEAVSPSTPASPSPSDAADPAHPATAMADRLELSLFSACAAGTKAGDLLRIYKTRARSLSFNIRENAELRDKLLSGKIDVDQVTGMNTWDLARKELQEERKLRRERYYKEEVVSLNDPGPGRRPPPSRPEPADAHPSADAVPRRSSLRQVPQRKDMKAEADRVTATLSRPRPDPTPSPLSASLTPLTPGAQVRLTGLQQAQVYNGKMGTFEKWDLEHGGRCLVRLRGGELRSVKASNLLLVT